MADEVQISFLDFPDNVRMRTSMYLMNPNHCVQEIVDNAVDEYFAGYCDKITVDCDKDTGRVTVSDNGRGIPTGPSTNPKFKGWSQLRQALGSLHSGGKISQKAGSYKTVTGGLNGKNPMPL